MADVKVGDRSVPFSNIFCIKLLHELNQNIIVYNRTGKND